MEALKHDLVIVGAGPAGLTAAIYAERYRIDFVIVGRIPGGIMTEAHEVENYPGVGKISGQDLTQRMIDQLKSIGKEVIADDIKAIRKEDGIYKLVSNKAEYHAKAVLLALGTKRNKLNIPGEEELCGKGVSYCATCDGFFYKEKTVAVIGGGDAALGAADYLSNIAEKVYLIHRRDEFRADPHWQERVKSCPKIETVMSTNVTEIVGEDKVEKLLTDTEREIIVDGVFIEIGETPQSALFEELGVEQDSHGFVKVHANQRTNVEGIWAAGDSTTNSNKLRQIITGCAEGAVAVVDIFAELRKAK